MVDENNIGAPKMLNNFGAIEFMIFPTLRGARNIGVFSTAPYKVITFNLLCFFFVLIFFASSQKQKG